MSHDARYFKDQQAQFYQDYGRTMNVSSSLQTLYSCFHPTLSSKAGEHDHSSTLIFKLDQVYYPSGVEVVELNANPRLEEVKEEPGRLPQNKNISFSINRESLRTEDDEAQQAKSGGIIQEKCVVPIGGLNIKAQSPSEMLIEMDYSKKVIPDSAGKINSILKSKLKDMLSTGAIKHSLRAPHLTREAEAASHILPFYSRAPTETNLQKGLPEVFDKPQHLQQRTKFVGSDHISSFQISLWEVGFSGNGAQKMIAQQRITVNRKVSVLHSRLCFSFDGSLVFIALCDDQTGNLVKSLVFNSSDLSRPSDSSLNLESLNINNKNVFLAPQMVLNPSTKALNICIQTTDQIIIASGLGLIKQVATFDQSQVSQCEIKTVSFKHSETKGLSVIILAENLKQSSKYRVKLFELEYTSFLDAIVSESLFMDFQKIKRVALTKVKIPFDFDLTEFDITTKYDRHSDTLIASLVSREELPDLEAEVDVTSVVDGSFLILASFASPKKAKPFSIIRCVSEFFEQISPFSQADSAFIFYNKPLKAYIRLSVPEILEQSVPVSRKYSIEQHQLHKDEAFIVYGASNLSKKSFFDLQSRSDHSLSILTYEIAAYTNQIIVESHKHAGQPTLTRLKTIDVQYLNPYVVIVENQSTLSIYSIHAPDILFQYTLEQANFVSFVEMQNGSLSLANSQTLYRHQSLLFLTANESATQAGQKLALNCIELPSYSGLSLSCSGARECYKDKTKYSKKFCIMSQMNELLIDWTSHSHKAVTKAFIGQTGSGSAQFAHRRVVLTIQTGDELLIKELDHQAMIKSFPASSFLPLRCCKPGLVNLDQTSLAFVYHSHSQQGTSLNLLKISQRGAIEQAPLYQLQSSVSALLSVQCFDKHILILDEDLKVFRFTFNQRTGLLKRSQELKLLDDIKGALEKFPSWRENIALSDEGVFIGPSYFQYLKKSITEKDAESDFEAFRSKIVGNLVQESLMIGPVLSVDCSRVIYLSTGIEISTFGTQPTEVKSQKSLEESKGSQRYRSVAEQPKDVMPSQKYEIHVAFSFNLFEIPLLKNNVLHMLHQDDFITSNVVSSTFTCFENDVIIILNGSFLAFTAFGKLLQIVITDHVQELISNSGVSLARVKIVQAGAWVALVFQDSQNYYILKVQKKEVDTIFYTIEVADTIRKFESAVYKEARLDISGNLYQVILHQNSKEGQVRVYCNNNEIANASELLTEALQSSLIGKSKLNYKKGSGSHFEEESKEHFINQSEEEVEHEVPAYDFQVVNGAYLVMKIGDNSLFYIDLKDRNATLKKLAIDFEAGHITSLKSTQNETLIQFIFTNHHTSSIFIWDLKSNIEHSVIKCHGRLPLSARTIKGVRENLNYFLCNHTHTFFDLRYEYPFNVFNGGMSIGCEHRGQQRDCSELQVSSDLTSIIGYTGSMQISFNPINLAYMEFLCDHYEHSEGQPHHGKSHFKLSLHHLQFSIAGNNPLHYFATHEHFLHQFDHQITHELQDQEHEEALHFINYVLFANQDGQSPISLAIKQYSKTSIEAMLEILGQSPHHFDYFKHLKVYFIQLLEMKSEVFEKFFDSCHTDQLKIHIKTRLNLEKGPIYLRSHTQHLSSDFIKASLKSRDRFVQFSQNLDEGPQLKHQITQSLVHSKTVDVWADPDNLIRKEDMHNDLKPVTLTILEYGWLLKGNAGAQFIEYLSCQESDSSLFKIKGIQTIINSQWKLFRRQYMKYQFIPFIIYFILIISFNTYLNPHTYSLRRTLRFQKEDVTTLEFFHQLTGYVMLVFAVYFLFLESLKYRRTKTKSALFLFFFNVFVILTYFMNYMDGGVFSENMNFKSNDLFLMASSALVMLCYYLLLLQLRYFETFAVLINLIFYALVNTITYNIIFLLVIAGFANSLYILVMLEEPDTGYDKITGPNIFTAFMVTFDGHIYHPGHMHHPYIFGIVQILLSGIVNVMLLHLLVSILEHIHSHVAALYTSERLKTKCRMINENELLFGRQEVFKDTKYVIRVEAEASDHGSTGHGDGGAVHGGGSGGHSGALSGKQADQFISSISAQFKTIIKQELQRVESTVKSLKGRVEVLGNQMADNDKKQSNIESNIFKLLNITNSHIELTQMILEKNTEGEPVATANLISSKSQVTPANKLKAAFKLAL